MPFAFTEHGALMAASVLNTPRAAKVKRCITRGLCRDNPRENLRASQRLFADQLKIDGHDGDYYLNARSKSDSKR